MPKRTTKETKTNDPGRSGLEHTQELLDLIAQNPHVFQEITSRQGERVMTELSKLLPKAKKELRAFDASEAFATAVAEPSPQLLGQRIDFLIDYYVEYERPADKTLGDRLKRYFSGHPVLLKSTFRWITDERLHADDSPFHGSGPWEAAQRFLCWVALASLFGFDYFHRLSLFNANPHRSAPHMRLPGSDE